MKKTIAITLIVALMGIGILGGQAIAVKPSNPSADPMLVAINETVMDLEASLTQHQAQYNFWSEGVIAGGVASLKADTKAYILPELASINQTVVDTNYQVNDLRWWAWENGESLEFIKSQNNGISNQVVDLDLNQGVLMDQHQDLQDTINQVEINLNGDINSLLDKMNTVEGEIYPYIALQIDRANVETWVVEESLAVQHGDLHQHLTEFWSAVQLDLNEHDNYMKSNQGAIAGLIMDIKNELAIGEPPTRLEVIEAEIFALKHQLIAIESNQFGLHNDITNILRTIQDALGISY